MFFDVGVCIFFGYGWFEGLNVIVVFMGECGIDFDCVEVDMIVVVVGVFLCEFDLVKFDGKCIFIWM